jgi:hypothetical protein
MAEQRRFTKPSTVRLVLVNPELGDAGQQGTFGPRPGAYKEEIDIATIVTRTNNKNADGSPIYTKQIVRFEGKSSIPSDGNATYVDANTGLTKNRYRQGDALAGQDGLFVYDYGDGTGDPVKIGEVIANGSNADGALQVEPTRLTTDLEKQNLNGQIRLSQSTQINSVMDEFPQGEQDQDALNDIGGTERNDPSPVDPEQTAKPLPANEQPSPFKGFAQPAEGWKYPLDLDPSKQDTLKIVAYERKPRGFTGGAQASASGSFSRRDTSNLGTPKGTILLPINGRITDNSSVDYGDNTMNAIEAFAASTAFNTVTGLNEGAVSSPLKDAFKNLNVNEAALKEIVGGAAASSVLKALSGTNQTPNTIASRLSGTILNPNLELLFKGPQLRNFPFSYLFLAREKREADQVVGIIRTLKENMVPRIESNFFLKSPNIFKIEYLKNSSPHPFLNRIKLCALRSCNVDYAPLGTYATFTDGMPHAIRMTLSFTELDPVYNEDYGESAGTGSDLGSSNASLIGY